MNRAAIEAIIAQYEKHGWKLRRALLSPEGKTALTRFEEGIKVHDSEIDALWFSRPSHEQREAWELRLISENPFALFETFEPDETEEDREDLRHEMEARLREKL